jgi:hypothetical protein
MQRITWKVRKLAPQSWAGEITFPDRLGHAHTVTSQGSTPQAAVKKAGNLASSLASNPMLMAALPPGSAQALQVVGKLASSKAAKAVGKKLKKMKFW